MVAAAAWAAGRRAQIWADELRFGRIGHIHGFHQPAVMIGRRLLADGGDFRRIFGDDALGRDLEDQSGADIHVFVEQAEVALIHALGGGDAGIVVTRLLTI